MAKECISCGMPMQTAEDFPMGDQSKDHCLHCARDDGSLKSYDEALEGMTNFIVQTQGLDSDAAEDMARQMMSNMPAWKNHPEA